MSENKNDYCKLADAPTFYDVSVSTLRRRRNELRETPDTTSIARFVVFTKDGESFNLPTPQKVDELTSQKRLPEWYANHAWLRQEYGPNPSTPNTAEQAQPPENEQPRIFENEQPEYTRNEVDQPEQSTPTTVADAQQQTIEILREEIGQLRKENSQTRELYKEMMLRLGTGEPVAKTTTPATPKPTDTPKVKTVQQRRPKTATTTKPTTQSKKKGWRGFLGI